jgi:hypothetical protein
MGAGCTTVRLPQIRFRKTSKSQSDQNVLVRPATNFYNAASIRISKTTRISKPVPENWAKSPEHTGADETGPLPYN